MKRRWSINPVYRKETKLRVRSVKFALTVLFYNLILIAIALFGFEIMFNVRWNRQIDYSNAVQIYLVMIVLETLMVMFLVPAFTAGSIAGEREKQTLEILLTTTLKPREIVWGKLISSISMVLLLVVSSLPVISIIYTIGGISISDLLQFVIAVFVFSIFLGSIGIWGSVMIKKTVPATVFTFGGILILCAGTAVIIGIIYVISNMYYYNVMQGVGNEPNISLSLLLLLINPFFALIDMIGSQYAGSSLIEGMNSSMGGSVPGIVEEHWFVCSLIVQMVFAVLIMHLSARLLDPLHAKKEKKRKKSRKKQAVKSA